MREQLTIKINRQSTLVIANDMAKTRNLRLHVRMHVEPRKLGVIRLYLVFRLRQ